MGLLGVLFLSAGVGKVGDWYGWLDSLGAYGLVAERFLPSVAGLFVVVEIASGVGLLFGWVWALRTATGLLVLFSSVLTYGLWLGLDVDCGCFGILERGTVSLSEALVRDLFLLVGCVYLHARRRRIILRNRSLHT